MKKFCLIVLGCAILTAQEDNRTQLIRSITVRLISTRATAPKPIDFTDIAAAWKARQVKLRIEQPLDINSIETAKEAIREMYGKSGRVVKVDHRISQIPPRSLEVAFEVVEPCPE
jgi:hypothetical protein